MNATALNEVQVDGDGFIFVPYAGRIKAAGNTPEALRRIITDKLDAQTPDPQVTVARIAGDGATVSVMGGIGGQGVYPIERPTRTLSAMLAKAGGVIDRARNRPGHGHPQRHIPARSGSRISIPIRAWTSRSRPGDVILVEEDQRAFTALGATGAQNRVPFETQDLSAIEAIAQVGGLSTHSGRSDRRLRTPQRTRRDRQYGPRPQRLITHPAHGLCARPDRAERHLQWPATS